jgi:hypothetical protein
VEKGGDDSFDNAIALCFECHAWAGHYFSGHPKGIKYSPEQLRAARAEWYVRVQAGQVATTEMFAYARYLICRDIQAAGDILKGNLDAFPEPHTLLPNNEVGRYIQGLLISHLDQSSDRVFGESYKTIADYKTAHPEAKSSSKDLDGYTFFDALRTCSHEEFYSQFAKEDRLSRLLLEQGATLNDLCVVVADNSQCGDGGVYETYLRRPAWVLFLAISNILDVPITLKEIVGEQDISTRFRGLNGEAAPRTVPFPKSPILSGHTVVVPLALMLGPIREYGEVRTGPREIKDLGEYAQVMHITCLNQDAAEAFRMIGPRFRPKTILSTHGGSVIAQDVHELDITNVYTLDREWRVGSCPHLFALTEDEDLRYVGELIAQGQGNIVIDRVTLPDYAARVLIAELEDEVSVISCVRLGDRTVLQNAELHRGQHIELHVENSLELEVAGAYFPKRSSLNDRAGSATRNQLICNFIWRWRQEHAQGLLDGAATLGEMRTIAAIRQ